MLALLDSEKKKNSEIPILACMDICSQTGSNVDLLRNAYLYIETVSIFLCRTFLSIQTMWLLAILDA